MLAAGRWVRPITQYCGVCNLKTKSLRQQLCLGYLGIEGSFLGSDWFLFCTAADGRNIAHVHKKQVIEGLLEQLGH